MNDGAVPRPSADVRDAIQRAQAPVAARGLGAPPQVSVIVPTFNRSAGVQDCLRSLFRQQDVTNFEVLVVDNNSTDDTREVIARFAKAEPRVRYFFEPSPG